MLGGSTGFMVVMIKSLVSGSEAAATRALAKPSTLFPHVSYSILSRLDWPLASCKREQSKRSIVALCT